MISTISKTKPYEKIQFLRKVLHVSQNVLDKISCFIQFQYKDEAGTVNSCFRGKDRTGLVRSLQHENRQILSLQEENRQMKLALEDVQRGMALLMEKHRKAVRNFERSNVLLELMERRFDQVCYISRSLANFCIFSHRRIMSMRSAFTNWLT